MRYLDSLCEPSNAYFKCEFWNDAFCPIVIYANSGRAGCISSHVTLRHILLFCYENRGENDMETQHSEISGRRYVEFFLSFSLLLSK